MDTFFGFLFAVAAFVLFFAGITLPNIWLIIASIPVGIIALVLLGEDFDFWWYW